MQLPPEIKPPLQFHVQTSRARMPASVKSYSYYNIGLYFGRHLASMLSERSRDIVEILDFYGPVHVGETDASEGVRIRSRLEAEADRLNADLLKVCKNWETLKWKRQGRALVVKVGQLELARIEKSPRVARGRYDVFMFGEHRYTTRDGQKGAKRLAGLHLRAWCTQDLPSFCPLR